MPIIGLKLYVFPIMGIIGGALYSCYNYFHVILNGGVGKNGSTVAVSQHAPNTKHPELTYQMIYCDACLVTAPSV